jgi:hypothetical protein
MTSPLAPSLRRCLVSLSAVAVAVGLIGSAGALTSCAEENVQVTYAAGYQRAPATISFLGLFKDGRVNAEAWDPVNEAIDRHLHGYPCAPLYSNDLTAKNPDLAAAIDDFTRANGVGDELLDKLAPMAKGDLIGIVVMAGQPPQVIDSGAMPPVEASGNSQRRGRMGGTRGGSRGPVTDHNAFELSVSLYSIKTHKAVGQISMSYTGKTVEDALARFRERFAAETAGSSCSGWSVDPGMDGEAIRKLAQDER